MQDHRKKRLVRANSLICKHGKDCARMGGFLRRKESKRGHMGMEEEWRGRGVGHDRRSSIDSAASPSHFTAAFIVHKLTVCMNEV